MRVINFNWVQGTWSQEIMARRSTSRNIQKPIDCHNTHACSRHLHWGNFNPLFLYKRKKKFAVLKVCTFQCTEKCWEIRYSSSFYMFKFQTYNLFKSYKYTEYFQLKFLVGVDKVVNLEKKMKNISVINYKLWSPGDNLEILYRQEFRETSSMKYK